MPPPLTKDGDPPRGMQGLTREGPRIKLSREARALVTARQRQANVAYNGGLDGVWSTLGESIETLAKDHHKSILTVQTDLHLGRGQIARQQREKTSSWNAFTRKKAQEQRESRGVPLGREALKEITQKYAEEYNALSKDEKDELTRELEDHKSHVEKSQRISTKAKVKDVSHTIGAIEKELQNLNTRTGMESILFVVPGATKLPLNGIYYSTPRIDGFLGSIQQDPQDLLGRMEGFAIQGLEGSARNHKARMSSTRTELRKEIEHALVAASGVSDAKMKWKNYWDDVVARYHVIIDGWPDDIPFGNLSEVVTSLSDMEALLRKWKAGKISFRSITDEEFVKLKEERDERIEKGEVEEKRRKVRSDKGAKRVRRGSNTEETPIKRRRTEFKSSELVDSDSEGEGDNGDNISHAGVSADENDGPGGSNSRGD